MKALINAHVSARGVDPKIPLISITDADFEKVLLVQAGSRARPAQMQHAARYHILGFSHQNPAYARKMSEKLEEILQRFKDTGMRWSASCGREIGMNSRTSIPGCRHPSFAWCSMSAAKGGS